MTDPSRDVDIEAFGGFGVIDDAPPPLDPKIGTHFVGDDCPGGHRDDPAAAAEAIERFAGLVEPLGVDEDAVARTPTDVPMEPDRDRWRKAKAIEQLVGLTYTSKSGDVPHIVTRHLYQNGLNDVICTCKASTYNLPLGCWAMVDARIVLGLPRDVD